MATTIFNMDADTGADVIKSESTPGFKITNQGTGPSLELDKSVVTSTASIATLSVDTQLDVNGPILVAAATIVGMDIRGASVASGAIMSFSGDSLISAVSIVFAASANWAGMQTFRVVLPDGTFGHIPVLPNAVVISAAVPA